jgi:hypothetical protein
MKSQMTTEQADACLATITDDDLTVMTIDDESISDGEVERLVEAAHKVTGRPSLTGPGQHSPNFTMRLSQAMKDRLKHVAQAQHRRESDVAREALDRYLTSVS